jgi:hypothetical protein
MFARINAQGGIFTRLLLNEAVEDRVRKFYPHVKEEGDVVFLIKMLIPNGLREEFLQKLEKLDKPKTYKTMFPDLAGAVRHCNLKLELSS